MRKVTTTGNFLSHNINLVPFPRITTVTVMKKVFLNEFEVLKKPSTLQLYKVELDTLDDLKTGYKITGVTARYLSNELERPVASQGMNLIASTNTSLPSVTTISMKHRGKILDISPKICPLKTITSKEEGFIEALKRFTNRQIDLIMHSAGYTQDGRYFFSPALIRVAFNFHIRRGVYITTKAYLGGELTVVSDAICGLRSSGNLLQDLDRVLMKYEIEDWREAVDYTNKINAVFRSRAPRLKTTYTEIRGFGEPEHIAYRFKGFDFTRSVEDRVEGRLSPLEWHARFGRKVSPDQPVVEVVAKGPFLVDQIPELLEEQPSLEKLKRITSSAREAQTRALLSSLDRLLATTEALKPLIDFGLINETPLRKDAECYAPVELDVGGDYIKVSKNRDFFTEYFAKKKLLSSPKISRIYALATEGAEKSASALVRCVNNLAKSFGVPLPRPKITTSSRDQYVDSLKDLAEREDFGREDLVYLISDFEEPEFERVEDRPYVKIKRFSLTKRVFPTQFIDLKTIVKAKKLKLEVGRQVFIQVVAKCGGEPWGLAHGFAPDNSIFVGIDRYWDPFGRVRLSGAATSVFDSEGSYVWSSAKPFSGYNEDWLNTICELVEEALKHYPGIKGSVYFIRDGGRGTRWSFFEEEAEALKTVCLKLGFAKIIHLTANKSSHYRVFTSRGKDILTTGTAPPLTAVLDLIDPNCFLVASTEPIFSRITQREMGTPRPVLYEFVLPRDEPEMKPVTAKALAWFCRHSWCSPTFMRLPAPLAYANKLSSLVAKIGEPLSPSAGDAPLYL